MAFTGKVMTRQLLCTYRAKPLYCQAQSHCRSRKTCLQLQQSDPDVIVINFLGQLKTMLISLTTDVILTWYKFPL